MTTTPDVTNLSIQQLLSLEGRCAVVTGGGVGIGEATVNRLAEAGATVFVADRDMARARQSAERATSRHGATCFPVEVDVADTSAVSDLADVAINQAGRLDIWVNNAGIYPLKAALAMTDADWDRVINVNLKGSFAGSREAARRMSQLERPGVIVNMSSAGGFIVGGPLVAHYVTSKHALRGLTKALALEFGPLGIRVMAVAPGYIDTPGNAELIAAAVAAGAGDAEKLAASASARRVLDRIGVPDDVARAVLFCASDMAMYCTGSALLVDAGMVAM